MVATWITEFFHIPLPPAILGLLMLLLTFILFKSTPSWLATPIQHCLPHLSLLFVPAIIGVMKFSSLTLSSWGALTFFLIASWLVGFIIVTLILQRILTKRGS